MPTIEHPHIAPDLRDLAYALADLKVNPNNARVHDRRGIHAIARSLATYGQVKPVVIKSDGEVVAGHGTVEAAQLLAKGGLQMGNQRLVPDPMWKKIAAVIIREDLAAGYAIADNKTAELSSWDWGALQSELTALDVDALSTGFEPHELEAIIGGSFTPPAGPDETQQPGPRDQQESRKITLSKVQWALFINACDKLQNELNRSITRGEAVAILSERISK